MPSATEILAALVKAALAGLPGVSVLRGGTLPEALPAAGLVNIVETDAVELDELLGGERQLLLELDVELAVADADPAARAATFDALAQAVAAALLADAALAAAVDHRRVNPLRDRTDTPVPGAASIRTATLPVELHYRTGINPLE